jgi:hypothetical protein
MNNINEDVILEIGKRRKLADHYYDNYRKYYENKNYSKASEFLWGSINALVYALGLLHGKRVSDHKKVVDFITGLANMYRDKEIGEGLSSAQSIHANFFHDFMTESMFEDNRERTEKLLEKLVKILDTELKEKVS